MKRSKKGKERSKMNKTKLFYFFLTIFLIFLFVLKIYKTNINNIVIIGNSYYSDQEIIDISGLRDYPKSIKNLSFQIKKRLDSDVYILSSSVSKNIFLNKVTIKVKENYPLFFYSPESKLILYDGEAVDTKYDDLTVINRIPDKVYDKFIKKLQNVDLDILSRMSEIEYKPNDVDSERFLIFMNDGNYVYINLKRLENINKYIDMLSLFNNKKGILYLDSGEYFDVFDE